MIYVVSWFESTTPQSVFFNSLSHAKYFVQRLKKKRNCRNVVLQENELRAA